MDRVTAGRLPVPILDDRRFQDLVDDATRLVQTRCPEWTNVDPGDPGIAIIEIFAWFTDMILYRMNQVPDAMYSHFLNLLGVRPLPSTIARVPVTFTLSAPQSDAVCIAARTEVSTVGVDGEEEAIVFSTVESAIVEPARLAAVIGPEQGSDSIIMAFEAPLPNTTLRIAVDVVPESSDNRALGWEYSTPTGWKEVAYIYDATAGLRRSGAVDVSVGDEHAEAELYGQRRALLRVRLASPHETAEMTTIRIETVDSIGVTVDAQHARRIEHEDLGVGTGERRQQFRLAWTPVAPLAEPEVIEIAGETWHAVETLAESGLDDRHFELDRESGIVRFGDGTYGRVPAEGAVIRVSYWHGGGSRGNVATGHLRILRSSVPYVACLSNPEPARGGADAEPVEQARRRAPGLLRSGGRAVSCEDFEHLARETAPELARVKCLEPESPDEPVRLLLVPWVNLSDTVASPAFVPDDVSFERVRVYIEERRVIGAAISLEPPSFLGVDVVATLRATAHDPRAVADAAQRALSTYLHPLVGGRDGTGWPFGRAVIAGELYGVLLDLPGVDVVDDVELIASDPTSGETATPATRVDLRADMLVLPGRHAITVQ